MMFQKLVAIEPINLISDAEKELRRYAREIVFYKDIPAGDAEIAARVGTRTPYCSATPPA